MIRILPKEDEDRWSGHRYSSAKEIRRKSIRKIKSLGKEKIRENQIRFINKYKSPDTTYSFEL